MSCNTKTIANVIQSMPLGIRVNLHFLWHLFYAWICYKDGQNKNVLNQLSALGMFFNTFDCLVNLNLNVLMKKVPIAKKRHTGSSF